MSVKLNRRAYDHAKRLIKEDKIVSVWQGCVERAPAVRSEGKRVPQATRPFRIREMVLAIDDTRPEDTKGRYKFPYGDSETVHRCGVLTAESRAGQYKYYDIENAGAHLHGMLEKVRA